MKTILIIIGFAAISLLFCNKNEPFDPEKLKAEVLNTVYSHNKAWTELEDIKEQKKYVHENIIFISPPYKTPKKGIKQYLKDYSEWMEHATVHHFKEVDPEVVLYNEGKFALVTFKIDMAFDYDDTSTPEWYGIDQMTLVNEKGKWLITSDMFAKQKEDE